MKKIYVIIFSFILLVGGFYYLISKDKLIKENSEQGHPFEYSPKERLAAKLFHYGRNHLISRRLKKASETWQLAIYIWPGHTLSQISLEKTKAELAWLAKETYLAGRQYYEALRYPEAIDAWTKALLTLPDDEPHLRQKILNDIKSAQQKIEELK